MKLIWTFLKFILIWLVIGAVIIIGTLILTGDILLGLKIFAGIFIVWLVIFIIYKIIKRQIAKKQVERLVNLERGADGEPLVEEFSLSNYLRQDRTLIRRISKLIKYLGVSKLKLKGSAIYVKPWYLMLGEDNSEKINQLVDSGIYFPIEDIPFMKSEDGNDVDFYLTNEAIFLDASNELLPGHGSKVPDKFIQLLKSLRSNRIKEPINSVILHVNSEDLYKADSNELRKLAEKHRFYITFIMIFLTIQLPVHLVITKCNKLDGFKQLVSLLGEGQRTTAFGNHNVDNKKTKSFIEETFNVLRFKINSLISLVLSTSTKIDYNIINTVKSFDKLGEGLAEYTNIVFSENEYQEEASLCGVYFTGDYSDEEGDKDNKIVAFAKGLYEQVIPDDRQQIHMLDRFKAKSFFYSNSFLFTWGIATILILSLFWFFALGNVTSFTNLVADYKANLFRNEIFAYDGDQEELAKAAVAEIEGDISIEAVRVITDINTFSYLTKLAEKVADKENNWILPWNTLTGNYNIGNSMKFRLYKHMQKYMITDLDSLLAKNLNNSFSTLQKLRLPKEELQRQIVDFALVLYYRINILQKFLSGASETSLRAEPQPFPLSDVYFREVGDITTDDIKNLNQSYIRALTWSKTTENKDAREELQKLKEQLNQLIANGDGDLQWISSWANNLLKDNEINVEDYFAGTGEMAKPLVVKASYTLNGEETIDDFIVKMKQIFSKDDIFYERLNNYRLNYKRQYLAAWTNFAAKAYTGGQKLRGQEEWFAAIQQLSGEANPYFNIMDKMTEETSIFLDNKVLEKSDDAILQISNNVSNITEPPETDILIPEWIDLLDYYQQMKQLGEKTEEGKSNSKLTKLALKTVGKLGKAGKTVAKTAKKAKKTTRKLGLTKKSQEDLNNNIEKAAAELDNFITGLTDFAFQAQTKSVMLKEMEGIFNNPDQPENSGGILAKMYAAIKNMQFLIGLESIDNKPFWDLLYGSILTIQDYVKVQAQEVINEKWNKSFIAEVQGVSDLRLTELIFGRDKGLLWKFQNENLNPYITLLNSGVITAKEASGMKVDFTPEFLKYLLDGREGLKFNRDSYPIYFEAEPTSVNREALFKPVRTTLSINCGDKTYQLVNLNFFSRDLIEWSPKCGGLSLTIDFSLFSISKLFDAPGGFPEFIKGFIGNSFTLTPDDFPEDASNLRDINVQEITLNYNILGKDELFKGLESFPLDYPYKVAKDWKDYDNGGLAGQETDEYFTTTENSIETDN